jgi:murein DD-endopeptidase MepM/ murein hydrolase activator NlpD
VPGKRVNVLILLLVIIAAVLGGGLYLLFRDTQAPQLSLSPDSGPIGPTAKISLQVHDPGSGIRTLLVEAVQGDKRTVVARRLDTPPHSPETLNFTLAETSLKDGSVSLEAVAVDNSHAGFGKGNTARMKWTLKLDSTPPRISVSSMAHNLKPGGTGAIAYTVSEEAQSSGVQVGDVFFPGYRQQNGEFLCFFAFPYYMTKKDFSPKLTATDMAGNSKERTFTHYAGERSFRTDIIRLPDSFLERKMPDFEDEFPGSMSQLERFLKVNDELRAVNRKALLGLGLKTASEPLWSGAFSRLPNGARKAGFGEKRTYQYENKSVDEQTHLGIDLASIRNAPVPAANSGTVVYADDFGIYGLAVIIDHGLGLQSLYAHLSEISVEESEFVEKGKIIGKTGTTGLAGGDHLHFAMLVAGLPVTPVEWWDDRWIRHNISSKLH